jgi:protein-L-isoaspartate(D-aspartate) O-methyltransferase
MACSRFSRWSLLVVTIAVVRGDHGLAAEPAAAPLPLVKNGNFEDSAPGEPSHPAGWYYVQQAVLVEAKDAPAGRRFLRFTNDVPGRTAQAQQHVRIDGREVRAIEVAASVAVQSVAPGQSLPERAGVRIHFYDADDVEVGLETLGPWAGTKSWSRETARFAVPERTRLILVEVGLAGATGTADFDDVQILPALQNPTALPRRIGK